MKLRIASDLHLEAFTGRDPQSLTVDFLPPREEDAESVLVLAGDISSKPDQLVSFIGHCEPRFKHVLYVPGNHEYYRNHYQRFNTDVRAHFAANSAKTTVACGDVVQVQIDDVIFILSTLWADGGLDDAERERVGRYLNDFYLIGYREGRFTVPDMMYENTQHIKKIELALQAKSPNKKVVISHHMPSYRLCHPRFGNECNGGFASNLDHIFAGDNAPALWIHGHTHDTIDTKLWNTRIVCNPRGYRGEWSSQFNTFDALFVEV